jgi:solute carrier family 6 GABA transporter-like protein 6/8/11/12/13
MSLLWACFFQTMAICWCFGADKVYNCIEQMIGYRINKCWYYCWKYISPAFMAVS